MNVLSFKEKKLLFIRLKMRDSVVLLTVWLKFGLLCSESNVQPHLRPYLVSVFKSLTSSPSNPKLFSLFTNQRYINLFESYSIVPKFFLIVFFQMKRYLPSEYIFSKMDCLCLISDKNDHASAVFNKTLDLAFGIIPKIQINFKME